MQIVIEAVALPDGKGEVAVDEITVAEGDCVDADAGQLLFEKFFVFVSDFLPMSCIVLERPL